MELEVIDIPQSNAMEQLTRAEVDMQIATARKYPRQLSRVKQGMLSFACLDEETAAGCFYTLPARKGGDGKPLQGPSVRLAEIAISQYQHIRAGSRIIADDGKFITAQGIVHDLENNVCISIEVKRRVTNKDGRRYSDDMIATTGNAACSIALRNAAFRVIPLALVKPVYEAAKRLAVGDGKSLVQRRAACVAHFLKLGVPVDKVCAVVGVRAADDIQLEHIETLMGYATAIKDGESTVDEVFKEENKQTPELKVVPQKQTEPIPEPTAGPTQDPISAKDELAEWASSHGVSFDQFCDALVEAKIYPDGMSDAWVNYQGIPSRDCDNILKKHKQVLVAFFARVKGGGK